MYKTLLDKLQAMKPYGGYIYTSIYDISYYCPAFSFSKFKDFAF
jgi:hypothetical protein